MSAPFVIIVFSVIGLLTGLVLLIIGLAGTGKKLTLAGTILSIVSVVTLILGVVFSVGRAVGGFKDMITTGIEQADSLQKVEQKKMELPEDNWNNEDGKDDEVISNLKRSVSEEERPYVKKGFFHTFYFPEFIRYPLAFPLAVHKNNFTENNWELVDERSLFDSRSVEKNTKSLVLNLTHLVFDDKMILLKSEEYDSDSNSKKMKYFLFEFGKTGVFEFKTERELIDLATKAGYTGSFDFFTVAEYETRFENIRWR